MKKLHLISWGLFCSVLFNPLFINAQQLADGMEILTPGNVEVVITCPTAGLANKLEKEKRLIVAGSEQAGYKSYFAAKEDEHGEELWVTDGTSLGTFMVKDIHVGSGGSDVKYITRFNEKVVFQANDGSGTTLWISDGTAEGTYKLTSDLSDPIGMTQLDETRFVFGAKSQESGTQSWLWISDGTEAGTELLKDCIVYYPGSPGDNDRSHFARVGRRVFFKGDTKSEEYGSELWVTDGTTDGTYMVKDINPNMGSNPDWMTNYKNEKLFFSANDGSKTGQETNGYEAWVSDGTVAGTYKISEGTVVNKICFPRVYKDEVYFRGNNELMKTDFTEAGTGIVAKLNSNLANGSDVDIFCEFDEVLFMKGNSGNWGLELFYTDGTEEGTVMHSDMNEGGRANAAWDGIVVSGSFYFRAQNRAPGVFAQWWELFKLDSKEAEAEKVVQLVQDGSARDYVHSLTNMCGDLYFTSDAYKKLFKYHYRKPDFDPEKDVEGMEPDFGPLPGEIVVSEGIMTIPSDYNQAELESLEIDATITCVDITSFVLNAGTSLPQLQNPNCLIYIDAQSTISIDGINNVVKVDAEGNATAENIVLIDNGSSNYYNMMDFEATNIEFTRELIAANTLSTIYLPFATTISDDMTVYKFKEVNTTTNYVIFDDLEGNQLNANTPYLFEKENVNLTLSANAVVVNATTEMAVNTYEFIGTYNEILPKDTYYGYVNGEFVKGTGGSVVPAFRAYLQGEADINNSPIKYSLSLDGSDGTTSVENLLDAEELKVLDINGTLEITTTKAQQIEFYSIDGKLVKSINLIEGTNTVSGLQQGVYLVKNQKVIIK